MLSDPGGWDEPILEVIHLWICHNTSMPSNLEKLRLVYIFRQEWENNHYIEEETRESHTRVQDVQNPWLSKPRHWLKILDTLMGFPRPSLNVVLDSINPTNPPLRLLTPSWPTSLPCPPFKVLKQRSKRAFNLGVLLSGCNMTKTSLERRKSFQTKNKIMQLTDFSFHLPWIMGNQILEHRDTRLMLQCLSISL